MGFHLEEEHVVGGSIDNRVRGRTILKIDFTNHTSSIVTLQGNPCRDLAGSLWNFKNPYAQMEGESGEQCFFIPALCEGDAGCIRYSRKQEIPVMSPGEYLETIFTSEHDKVEMKVAPVLDLEWFTPKFGQVEIDCERMTVELVEMVWALGAEEAAEEEERVNQVRVEYQPKGSDDFDDFVEGVEILEEYIDDGLEPEPHELEELCFLIVQEFIVNSADDSTEKEELHNDLLKLQEQIAGAFIHHNDEGGFDDLPDTIKRLGALLPFIDRAGNSARYVAETTTEHLDRLRAGIVKLRDELGQATKE